MPTGTSMWVALALLATAFVAAAALAVFLYLRVRKTAYIVAALDALPFALWLRERGGRIVLANKAYVGIAGNATSELTPHSAARAMKVRETGQAQVDRVHLVTNGERKLFEFAEIPLPAGGYAGMALDYSELERLQKELGHSGQALTEIMENSGSAMALFDSARNLQKYNNAYLQLWKLDEPYLGTHPRYEEILERLRERRLLPEQANFQLFRKEQLSWFTDLTQSHQEFFYLPDGTSLRLIIIPYAIGGLIFIYENMTDQLALEQSFNQAVAVKKATLDNLFEGVAMFGEDGRLKLSNPRFAEIWQLAWDFIESQPRFTELLEEAEYLFDSQDWQRFSQVMLAVVNQRRRASEKLELIDGRVIQWNCLPLPDGAMLMTYLDITDSARMEQSLRERNRVLEEAASIKTKFLANVSYELRSPLTSIKGFTEFLLQGAVGDVSAKQREYLKDIHQSTIDLSAMIDDILDIASLEAGYVTLDVAEFDLYLMLSSVYPFAQEKLNRRDIHLNFQCSPAIGTMVGDERRLRHTLLQLLDNMMKFCPRGSDLLFKVWGEEEDLVLLLQDVTSSGAATLITHPAEIVAGSASSVVATDTLDAIGSPIIRSLIGMHGGRVDVHYTGDQRCKVLIKLKRHYADFEKMIENVQISSAL